MATTADEITEGPVAARPRGSSTARGLDGEPTATVAALLEAPVARAYGVVPIAVENGELAVGMSDPADTQAIRALRALTGMSVRAVPMAAGRIAKAQRELYRDEPSQLASPPTLAIRAESPSERERCRTRAEEAGIPFVSLRMRDDGRDPVSPPAAQLLDEGFCRHFQIVAVAVANGVVVLATARPSDTPTVRLAALIAGREPLVVAATPGDVEAAIERAFATPAAPSRARRRGGRRKLREALVDRGSRDPDALAQALRTPLERLHFSQEQAVGTDAGEETAVSAPLPAFRAARAPAPAQAPSAAARSLPVGETPFTPDTAPSGISVRRPWFVTPLLLIGFGVAAALMEPSFPRMTYEYGSFVKGLAQDPHLLLPKQSSMAIRPLFVALLVMFSIFAAGSLRYRLRLLATSVALYLSLAVLADVALAWLSQHGGPSPFTAYGNVIAGLIGVLAAAISVFANAALPRDVRLHREVRLRWVPVLALAAGVMTSVAGVALIERFAGGQIDSYLSRVPLFGSAGSVVVMFFVVLPAALCLIGAVVGLLRFRPRSGEWHSVAFVVPARDEEGLIGDCVRAIGAAAASYPGDVQAIVVENGSSDATAAEARAALEEYPLMSSMLLECAPLGKSRALNVGLAQADADIVVRIDADTLVTPELLTKLVPHFWEEAVGGVGVLPVPREPRGWIAHMRAVETYYGAAFKRAAQNVADCVAVLPGATVAYRRSILLRLGGFAEGVNGEDADITVRVGRLGYRIVSDSRIKTYTDIPHSFSQLREQRIRWSRGLYHMVGRNRSAMWMRQGVRGMWMLPWASFMMFRKLMLVPFAVAVAAMILAHPSTLPLREVAAAGAIVIGVQLLQMAAVMLWYGKPSLVAVLPTYLVFRLIVTYYALEALLTLKIGPRPEEIAGGEPQPAPATPPETLLVNGPHATAPNPIKQEAWI